MHVARGSHTSPLRLGDRECRPGVVRRTPDPAAGPIHEATLWVALWLFSLGCVLLEWRTIAGAILLFSSLLWIVVAERR
jgi:hypothetical protein